MFCTPIYPPICLIGAAFLVPPSLEPTGILHLIYACKIFYIGLPATYYAIIACGLLTYSLIVQSPMVSNETLTKAHSHSPLSPFLYVVPTIPLANLLLNPPITFIIESVTTHILLLYRTCSSPRRSLFLRSL